MKAGTMKGSEFIAQFLKESGVTHVFYQEVMFWEMLLEAQKRGVTGICAHSEGAAGYMADGYARASGKLGVCMAQAIGGANLVGGIHDAYLANTPVVALTGKKAPKYQYRNSYQESSHPKMYGGVTKFDGEVTCPEELPHLLRTAFHESVSGKARPTHLDMLGFVGHELEIASIGEPFDMPETEYRLPMHRTAGDPDDVARAAERIARAEKPLMVIGRGAILSGAQAELLALVEKLDIPFCTTPDGKGIIDEAHPLWTGVIGNYGMPSANRAAQLADLVIYIGTQTSDQTTLDWTAPARSTAVVQIDIDPAELGRNYPNCTGICGDAKLVCGQLLQAVEAREQGAWRKVTNALLAETLRMQEEQVNAKLDRPINTALLCTALQKQLPDDAIVVADTGYSAVWGSVMLRFKPGQKFLRAAGSLGWSYPASLGAKCACPDKPVICFTGDGAFYYHMAEMETAVKRNIKTVTVINNNSMFFQPVLDDDAKRRDILTFAPINFAEVARSFGLFAVRVENPEELDAALAAALAADKPALVEVMTANAPEAHPLNPRS